jgi:hypothetical protein
MKRFWLTASFLLLGAIFFSGCSLPSGKKAALSVSSTPQATIFLDGEHLGQTPYYNEKLKAGEYVLKLVPEAEGGEALTMWEGRINLVSGILTVVNRQLGLNNESSSGEILSFEPLADKNAVSIAVVTTPDAAVVNLDGEPRGFAPLSIDDLSEGDHVLVISATGYQEKSIKAKTVKGYKLIASVQLAREPIETETEEATPSAETEEAAPQASPKVSPSPSPQASASPSTGEEISRPYVQIKDENGDDLILRSPNQYSLLDEQSGWYQVEYKTGKDGWISGKYAEKYE